MPDHYKITVSDLLYRRFPISDEPNYAVFWKLDRNRKVPSSAAFKTKPNENGLSVNIARLTTPEATAGAPGFSVAEFSAAIPLSSGYSCIHDPQIGNNAHALIEGDTNPIAKKLSKAVVQVYTF